MRRVSLSQKGGWAQSKVESMCKGTDYGSSMLLGHPKGQQGAGLVMEVHWGI